MALFSSLFKGLGKRKEEPAAAVSVATPTLPPPVSPSPTSQMTAINTVPTAPTKRMQLDEIVAALHQIQSIMAEPTETTQASSTAKPDLFQTIALGLGDIIQIAPSSFNQMPAALGDKVGVAVENLFSQMSTGKVETTLGCLLAGVPKQYLVNPAELKSEAKVTLPLSLVVAAVDPDDLKRLTGTVRKDSLSSELPNIFTPAQATPTKPATVPTTKIPAAPAKPDAFTTLRLKLSDLQTIMPTAFSSTMISGDASVEVLVEDIFGQLAKGKVEVPVNKLLASVPQEYLALSVAVDPDARVALPLPVVVAAISPEVLKKRTTEQSAKSTTYNLPDLFNRAAPLTVEVSKPAAPTIPVPEAVSAAAITPAELKKPAVEQPVETTPREDSHLFKRPEKKEAPQRVEIPKPATPTIPVPESTSEAESRIEVEALSVPEIKPLSPVEPTTSFTGLPPKKFMPMDLIAGEVVTSPPLEEPVVSKSEKQESFMPVAPTSAPSPISFSGEPVLLLRGLDLNQVSAEELIRVLDGIGDSTARRIVEDRIQNGPFFGLYDLARVPGIGSKIYEKITGQPWLDEKYGQLRLVNEILGRWTGQHPDFREVAAKFKAIPGFEGCVILHRDGHLLASSWQIESPDRLQAMAPQILKKVKHYMRNMIEKELCSVTVVLEGLSCTFVENEDICFVAIHNAKGFSRRHLQIVNGLGMAIGRRFSGYRGA